MDAADPSDSIELLLFSLLFVGTNSYANGSNITGGDCDTLSSFFSVNEVNIRVHMQARACRLMLVCVENNKRLRDADGRVMFTRTSC